ncbi:hypothetical protein [Alkalihalobacillus sp. AL-G]|uniref:hypothetical protein n=1 Tax=Alkalihalobacillus sp. AL-G TaxID=2926399 RepID=UPI00272C0AA6|nr:hypothetical protein [Alkalihalobacillus sp. AL-G]WLD93931.1 hypothetical protein MOJ78_03155 [Alkalihalobacillus sp. AL-G]
MHTEALMQIAVELNRSEVLWGVGGSTLLSEYGLVGNPADLDLIIDYQNKDKALMILDRFAVRVDTKSKRPFKTACFEKYRLGETFIDVMADFAIGHEKGIYKMPFDSRSITKTIRIGEVPVPFTSLEDWYILYQLIPNKGDKTNLIELYWKEHGLGFPMILERALKHPLPDSIQKRCIHILLQTR